MSAMQQAEAYFNAWNEHDAAAIAGLFAEGGSYSDPNVPDGVAGEKLFENHRQLERRLFKIANDELAIAQDQMLLLGRKTAKERLATFLINLSEREELRGGQGGVVYLPMVQEDIADYLGLTIETVSRTMSQLKRDRLIHQTTSHEFELPRIEELRHLAEQT